MGLIKYFNQLTLNWEIVAGSDAANISLHNEFLLDDKNAAISTARAFQKINNKISQLEHHLAWVYLNGAKGGGGGGGGGGGYAYTITINNGKDVFYTSTNSITINMTINSGTTRKTFYVNAINMATGRMLVDGESHSSMVPFDLTIPNLPSSTNYIYLQAYDSLDNYTELVEIVVNVGSLSIVQSGRPGAIYTIGSNNNTIASFQVLNKTGNVAYLLTYKSRSSDPLASALESGGDISNGFKADYITVISNGNQASVYTVDFNNDLAETSAGKVATYKTILYSHELGYLSAYFTNQITVSTGDSLSAVLYGLAEVPEDSGDYLFEQNNYCTFDILLYYEKVDVRTFYYRYKVYKGEELFYESQINSMQAATSGSTSINCPTLNFPIGDDYSLIFEACATEDFNLATNPNLYSIVTGYFAIKQGQTGILQDYKGALLARFGSFNFPGGKQTKWTYTIPPSGDYYFTSWPVSTGYTSTSMNIHNATSNTGLTTNVSRYVSLQGDTYATIDEFSKLFPQSTNLNASLFGTGFYIQVTYEYLSENPVDQTILSFGEYQNGELYRGFEINSDYIKVAFGTVSGVQIDTPIKAENAFGAGSAKSTKTTTIGLNVWSTTIKTASNTEQNTYYFALYIDGVMTKCALIPSSVLTNVSTGWMFAKPLYLGCRNDLSNQANCNIYDFKLYAQNQPDLSIVHNYMSATEQAHLILSSTGQPVVDDQLDTILRNKNLFVKGGNTCLLCDTSSGEYLDPATMYSRIASSYSDAASGYDLDYPIVYIEEVGTTSDMYQCVKATWDTQATVGGIRITKKNWPVKITITTKYGTTVVQSDDVSLQPTVAIQGTSSLSYNSKNLEIIMGQVTEGVPKLLKINDWLPENEFTLKADVVDSAHVNNVAIGNFVNNTEFIEHYAGSGYSSDNIGRRIKKTSEGFPCLVFVKYSDGSVDEGTNITRDTDGSILSKVGKTEFMGVYNFNLGRYAYFNLGLKKLESFSQDNDRSDYAPQVITEYTYSEPNGIYSMEVGDNFGNTEELFTQADKTISEYITECRYTPTSEDDAYDSITSTLFTTLAQSDPTITFNRKRRTASGAYEDILDNNGNPLKWASDSNLSDEVTIDLNLDLTEARKYLVIALVFGLVDSVCKNMVFRTWDATRWVLAFYDMDTAFKKDNRGASSVKYDAHYNYFFNVEGIYSDAMNSYTEGVRLFPRSVDEDPNWKYTYAGMCSSAGVPNRLWNVIQLCDTRKINSGDLASTLPGLYWQLRNNYISDPDVFIDNYFSNYINKTGAIMYNYDYRQKYVSYSQVWQEGVGLVADTSASQTEFLDGTRVSQVRAWFKKRINFLDSVYSSFRQGDTSSNSYMKDTWNSGQVSSDTVTAVTIVANQKCKIGYAVSSGDVRYIWVDETPRSYNLLTQTQGNLFYLYGNTIIKLFPGFNKLGWTNFTSAFNFKLLQELDMTGLEVSSFTEANNLNGMPNLRILNLTDFKYTGDNSITIGLTNNTSIQEVYLRGKCNISSFQLPSSGTLKVLDLTDNIYIASIPTQTVSGITQSCLVDQSALETLLLKGTSISNLFGLTQGLINLPSLKNLTLPSSLEKLTIQSCGLETFELTWSSSKDMSPLTHVQITDCEELRSINLSGQNNLLEVSIYNCPNLEEINISAVTIKDKNIQIDFSRLTKLKKLVISDTDLFEELDLTNSPDIEDLNCYQCSRLKTIKCPYDETNPIELNSSAFDGCASLTNLEGNFVILGRCVFRNCFQLPFDDLILEGKLNLTFGSEVADLSLTFYSCELLGSKYSYPIDFIQALPQSVSNISEMFKNTDSRFIMIPDMFCRVVNGEIANLNVTNISGIFLNTNVSGNFYSEYTTSDGKKHGFFAHMPYLLNCELAFSDSTAERFIDNEFFHFSKAEQLTNVDSMFAYNYSLTAVNDTTGEFERVEEPLHSKDFFIRLTNCVHPENRTTESQPVPNPDWMYPHNVFNGSEVKMTVDLNNQGRPFLFHVSKEAYRSKRIYTEGLLYAGIHLILDPDNCDYSYLFGGNSLNFGYKSISDESNTYYIPLFVKISKPFTISNELYLDLNNIDGDVFFDRNTQFLISPFHGMNVLLTDHIPDNLFKGATNVQSLEGFFSDLNLNNLDGDVYDFNEHDLFKYCTSLQNIDSIFRGCNKFRMRLAPEMFKNCKLKNVSYAFEDSRVIEKLPERLFYMVSTTGIIQRTIEKMTNVFNKCYNLGYSDDYRYAEVPIDLNGTLTTWDNHVVERGTFLGDEYTIPQDLFWYCAKNPEIDFVLGQMFWKETTITQSYDINTVSELDNVIGPQCTIPNLFLSNPETQIYLSDKLNYVFANTYFKPSGTLGEQDSSGVYQRGNLYPEDLFEGMSKLSDIQGMFYGTVIDKNCMINEDLFVYNKYNDGGTIVKRYLPLKNISYVWLDCTFTYLVTMDESGQHQASEVGHPQLNFEMFDPLNTLTNASYLFAATRENDCGLRVLSDRLFRGLDFEGQLTKTLNISGMFMYSHLAVDSCPAPLFTSVRRNLAAGYNTYLNGLTEDLISNSDAVRSAGMYPTDWDY